MSGGGGEPFHRVEISAETWTMRKRKSQKEAKGRGGRYFMQKKQQMQRLWHGVFKEHKGNKCERSTVSKEESGRTSLVVQWLRIRLPKQGTQVWSVVWKDRTRQGTTKPVRCSYWACSLEPASQCTDHNQLKPVCLEPLLHKKSPAMRSPCTATRE